jgi:hypothetical protein
MGELKTLVYNLIYPWKLFIAQKHDVSWKMKNMAEDVSLYNPASAFGWFLVGFVPNFSAFSLYKMNS